jgi:hypothetical protein
LNVQCTVDGFIISCYLSCSKPYGFCDFSNDLECFKQFFILAQNKKSLASDCTMLFVLEVISDDLISNIHGDFVLLNGIV